MVMAEREKRGRPSREPINRKTSIEKQGGRRTISLRDAFCELLAEFPKQKGDKPSPTKVFVEMEQQLQYMYRGNYIPRDPSEDYNPSKPRETKDIKLDLKSQYDIEMVSEGFKAVAYDYLDSGFQCQLKRHFERNLKNTWGEVKTDTPFDEFRREFKDRFELTYEQAKILQKIVERLNLSYDPGGREMTPENLAKRTFYGEDYLLRPVKHDVHPHPPDDYWQKYAKKRDH